MLPELGWHYEQLSLWIRTVAGHGPIFRAGKGEYFRCRSSGGSDRTWRNRGVTPPAAASRTLSFNGPTAIQSIAAGGVLLRRPQYEIFSNNYEYRAARPKKPDCASGGSFSDGLRNRKKEQRPRRSGRAPRKRPKRSHRFGDSPAARILCSASSIHRPCPSMLKRQGAGGAAVEWAGLHLLINHREGSAFRGASMTLAAAEENRRGCQGHLVDARAPAGFVVQKGARHKHRNALTISR